MSQAVYFVTRYSVVGKAQHTWQIAKSAADYETYRSGVLDPDRLARRLKLFTEITVPSIAAQAGTGVDVNWLVLVALELPESHLESLREAVTPVLATGARVEFLKVAPEDDLADIDAGVYAGMGQAIRVTLEQDLAGTQTTFATVRLDDDDALAVDYTERITRYLRPEFAGMHISFGRGLQAVYSGNSKLTDTRVLNKPLIALGLALVNVHDPERGFLCPEVHVHGFGNHANLTERTPVIIDGSGLAYLRTLDFSSDLGDSGHARHTAATAADAVALGLANLSFELPEVETPARTPTKKPGLFRR
jgi:hypothetical protein